MNTSLVITNHQINLQKAIAISMRKTATEIGGAASFSELAALIIAKRFESTGRKKDARKILTSYLQIHRNSNNVLRALEGFCL